MTYILNDFCPNCEEFRDLELIKRDEIFKVNGEEITVESEFFKCTTCKEEFYYHGKNKSSLQQVYERLIKYE